MQEKAYKGMKQVFSRWLDKHRDLTAKFDAVNMRH